MDKVFIGESLASICIKISYLVIKERSDILEETVNTFLKKKYPKIAKEWKYKFVVNNEVG